jgi:hypothetical protein
VFDPQPVAEQPLLVALRKANGALFNFYVEIALSLIHVHEDHGVPALAKRPSRDGAEPPMGAVPVADLGPAPCIREAQIAILARHASLSPQHKTVAELMSIASERCHRRARVLGQDVFAINKGAPDDILDADLSAYIKPIESALFRLRCSATPYAQQARQNSVPRQTSHAHHSF